MQRGQVTWHEHAQFYEEYDLQQANYITQCKFYSGDINCENQGSELFTVTPYVSIKPF
jgi:hypothetical protein